MLKAEKLCASYGKGNAQVDVLKDFEFNMDNGAFEALMGPSGSGKSTFLHIASRLLTPSSGKVFVGDAEITSMGDSDSAKFRRSNIGVVFQSFNLVESLNVEENIVLPVRLAHGAVDKARLEKLINILGLEGKEKKKPGELSGGECQRVAIGRAVYASPKIIFADEPTGNLDTISSQGICKLLSRLNKDESCAILLVTHDPVVASYANKVHFLKNGVIVDSIETDHDASKISGHYLKTFNRSGF